MSGDLVVVWAKVGAGRLAVRMPNWVGDALHAVPALAALRRAAPSARIELHARAGLAGLLRALTGPWDEVRETGASTLAGTLASARAMAGAAAAVVLPNSLAAALPPALARVPIRAGAARNGRRPLLTHPTHPPGGLHMTGWYLAAAGLAEQRSGHADGAVALAPGVAAAAAALVPGGPFVALVPGAAYGGAKRWGGERFAALGRRLRERGLEVLVLGGPEERELGDGVAAAAGGRSLAGQTDGACFAGLLAAAALVVANDSGALHLAAALGTPVVGIFGATDPAASGPRAGRAVVLRQAVPCSPCGRRECNRPRHECMEAVPVEAAVAAASRLLDSGRRHAAGSVA